RFCLLLGMILAYTAALFLYILSVVTQAELIAASLLQIPIAFLVATRGIARDRSGEVIQQAAAPSKTHALRKFSSAMDAQTCFEARVHRWNGAFVATLPILLFVVFVGAEVIGTGKAHPAVFAAIARLDILMFTWLTIAAAAMVGFSFGSFQQARWQ